MTETIYFNGKKYNDVAEMPSSVRQLYEKLIRFSADDNQDGVPDILQSGGLAGIKETINMIKNISQMSASEGFKSGQISLIRISDTGIYINGKEYSSVAEMSDYTRQEYERIVNTSQDGMEEIFDESWRQIEREKYFNPHDDEILNTQISNTDPSIEMVDSTRRFIMIAAVSFLILAGLAAAWFLLF